MDKSKGIFDVNLFDYSGTLGTEIGSVNSKGSTAIRGAHPSNGDRKTKMESLGCDEDGMSAGVYGKRERVLYGESLMTHAMVFTGIDVLPEKPAESGSNYPDHAPVDVSGLLLAKRDRDATVPEPRNGASTTASKTPSPGYIHRLRIENSWGEPNGDKGYYSASVSYFHEFVYQAVVHLDDMTEEMRRKVEAALKIEPKVMPLWDPMGALAL